MPQSPSNAVEMTSRTRLRISKVLGLATLCVATWSASDARAGGALYFTDLFKPDGPTGTSDMNYGTIKRMRSNGSQIETVATTHNLLAEHQPGGFWRSKREFAPFTALRRGQKFWQMNVVVHRDTQKMFWGARNRDWLHGIDHIYRANPDGTGTEAVLQTQFSGGLAIDHRDRIYWMASVSRGWDDRQNSTRKKLTKHWSIHRANLDGSSVETLLEGEGESLGDLAIDPKRNRLFYVVVRGDTYTATLDGEEVETFVRNDPKEDVRSLAVDPETGDLYWNAEIDHHHHQRIVRKDSTTGELSTIGPEDGFGHVSNLTFVPDYPGALTSMMHPTLRMEAPRTSSASPGETPPQLLAFGTGGHTKPRMEIVTTSDFRLSVEFDSVPGEAYQVQYSHDLRSWQNAGAPVVAESPRTSWTDTGSPSTESHPAKTRKRFYRVITAE